MPPDTTTPTYGAEVPLALGDLVTLVRGTTYKGSLVGEPGPALLGLGSIEPGGGFRDTDFKTYGGECPAKLMLAPGDLFAALKGATKDGKMIGSVARVPPLVPSGRLTQDTVKLQFHHRDKPTQSYVYWLLRTPQYREYCAGRATGSAVVALSRDDFLAYPVPAMTPLRAKMAELFDEIETRIALLRETNATLEAIAQALFKSWFVDFDPVRARQQGLAPEGMDEATAALFPDGFEESELGLLPKGWKVCAFTETIDVIGGGTPKTSVREYWNGKLPWFSVADAPATSDVYAVSTEKHISELGLANSSTKLLRVGTTIISARGTVGKLALTGCPMTMNQSCYAFQGKAHDSYFTYFSTRRLVEALKQRAHGSVFDTITRDTLAGVSVTYPDFPVIQSFERVVQSVMERIRENLFQAQTLSTLRDTLLPRLISGQLRLPDAQAELEGALP